jgi:type II secretory pathway component PulF
MKIDELINMLIDTEKTKTFYDVSHNILMSGIPLKEVLEALHKKIKNDPIKRKRCLNIIEIINALFQGSK